jgi:hypothetical protein
MSEEIIKSKGFASIDDTFLDDKGHKKERP